MPKKTIRYHADVIQAMSLKGNEGNGEGNGDGARIGYPFLSISGSVPIFCIFCHF